MTKKFILLFALCGMLFSTEAQNVMLPSKGKFSLEIGFNPFSNSFETFKLEGAKLKGRYFLSDKDALRLGVGFNYTSSHNRLIGDDHVEKYSNNNTKFAIDLGYERHWTPSRRIDLYAMAYAGYELSCTSDKVKYQWNPEVDSYINSTTTTGGSSEDPDYDKFSVTIGTGIDFYIVKGLYVGASLGLETNHKNYRDKVTENGWGDERSKTKNYLTETQIKLDVKPSLHLGWTF